VRVIAAAPGKDRPLELMDSMGKSLQRELTGKL